MQQALISLSVVQHSKSKALSGLAYAGCFLLGLHWARVSVCTCPASSMRTSVLMVDSLILSLHSILELHPVSV